MFRGGCGAFRGGVGVFRRARERAGRAAERSVGGTEQSAGLMSSLFFGVGSTDPATFTAVSLGLAAVSLFAAYLPGRRATQVDPMVALRAD